MRHLFIGYVLVYFTPILSILFHFGPLRWASEERNFLIPVMMHTGANIAVITILIVGLTLYVFGYKKHQIRSKDSGITLAFSPLLIIWGVIVMLIAFGFYDELIQWSKLPGVRELTIWDYMEYGSWALKGILWIISGILLITTSSREKIGLRKTA